MTSKMEIIEEKGPEKRTKGSFIKESIISVYKSWVVFILFTIIFLGPVFFVIFMLFPSFWIFGIPYLCWMWIDRITPYKGGRTNRSFKNLKIWKFIGEYFPLKLIKTCEIPADKNYIFCAFPHGIFPFGSSFNLVTSANDFRELFPGIDIHGNTLNACLRAPIFRDILLLLGVCAAAEDSMKYILNGPPGSSCLVTPGGGQESMKSVPSKHDIVLKNRKGFVRVALNTGASLVPVFSFGETNVYRHSGKWYTKFESTFYSVFKVRLPFIHGRGFCQSIVGIFPLRTPISTVVGKPIDLPKIENPSMEDIDKYHSIFVKELEDLFNNYKEKYDLDDGINAVLNIH